MNLIPAENKRLKKKIPKRFYGKGIRPKANTVGKLIKLLEQLPKGMKIDEPVEVTVFNINYTNVHVGVKEVW